MRKISRFGWVGVGCLIAMTLFFTAPQKGHAALKAPDFAIQSRLLPAALEVTGKAPSGYHFNTEAPMAAQYGNKSFKPKSAAPHRVIFSLPASAKKNSIRISLYLCDDAKTFCEKHVIEYQATKNSTVRSSSEPSNSEASSKKTATRFEKHGFILNDSDAALALAKKDRKPLLIDFFGIWCPPCNELDDQVFSSREFQRLAKGFVLLKLDADSPHSWKLKSKFGIGGYPTVVFASSEGDEIARVVGFRPKPEFLQQMHEAIKNPDLALTQLEKEAAGGNRAAADRAGVIRYERGEYKRAAELLSGSQAQREYLDLAEIGVLHQANAPVDVQIARIERALQEFPKTPNSVDWYGSLADLYAEKKDEAKRKNALQAAIELSIRLAKTPAKLKGYDATSADLLEGAAEYKEQLLGKGNETAARADWLAAADAYKKRGLGATERGNNLEYAYCLGKAGEYAKARKVYERLERAYPDEFTFFFYHGRLERDAHNPDLAFDLFKKALARSYGDNRLRVATFAAETAGKLGKRDEAKAIADNALKDVKLPDDLSIRSHRYADQLRKFRETLN